MEAERWKRIEELCQAALEQPLEKRAAFLAQACPDDPHLRGEVEALLDQQADSFLESAPVSAIRALSAGVKLGNFEIVELLGRGGMGEVWRARDARLRRDVAIKVLPAGLSRDPDRIARFQREARAVSALNHPNIVAVHDIGCDNGTYWIASELVRGDNLRRMIEACPLPAPKTIEIVVQVAAGLAAAHAAGLVHRDLKPDNIMVTRDGQVKILDFGLAKQRRTVQDSTTIDLTDEGVVLGTAGYMSPEQVRGEAADHRSDLFSFGVVLYEMLCGKRPFGGNSSVEVMSAILKEEVPELPPTVPPALELIVRRCLEKEPERRFQNAADLAFALQPASPSLPPRPRPSSARKWVISAAALIAIAGGLLFWLSRPLPPPRVTGIVRITRDNRQRAHQVCPLLSDGTRLFFQSSDDEPRQAPVTGGDSAPLVLQTKRDRGLYLMDISHDRTEFLVCRFLGFPFCELWVEPVVGGSPRRLGNLVAHEAAAWSPNGLQLAYVRGGELHLASRDGSEIRKLASIGGMDLHWSPDGRRIVASVSGDANHPTRLWETQADGSGSHPVLPRWNRSWPMRSGVWTPDGKYFVFLSNNKIWAVREKQGWLHRGSRMPVELNTGSLTPEYPLPSVDGKRLFFEGYEARNEFLHYDLKSRAFTLALAGISGTGLEYSRDSKWITYESVPEGSLFRSAADGSQRLQLTSPPLEADTPHWSTDGSQIAFSGRAKNGDSARIYVVPSDGGEPRQVSHGESGPNGDWDASWSPDGVSLAFGATFFDKPDKMSIHVVDMKTNHISSLPGSEGMWSPRWSPDGHFIAGVSGLQNKLLVYDLRSRTTTELFDEASGFPSWSRDGQFLFFHCKTGWWRVRVRDRRAELVNSLKDVSLVDFGWFAIAPDDSLITARKTGVAEIYALDLELP